VPVCSWEFSEWTFGALIFVGFWNKTAGVLGALGGIASFISTTTIIPFMPGGWAASAGGFPAMTEKVAFLMKDFVLLAVSFYLLKQDLLRLSSRQSRSSAEAGLGGSSASPKNAAKNRVELDPEAQIVPLSSRSLGRRNAGYTAFTNGVTGRRVPGIATASWRG